MKILNISNLHNESLNAPLFFSGWAFYFHKEGLAISINCLSKQSIFKQGLFLHLTL